MKTSVICEDKYEAHKLASLIFVKDGKETFLKEILNVIGNELVISLKDKSAHSILLKDARQVEVFADFIQSVVEKQHKITSATSHDNVVEIIKE